MGYRAPNPESVVSASGSRERAQSELIGVVLLVGMVLISATIITISGANILQDFQERTVGESTTNQVERIDQSLSSVSSVSGITRAEFSIGDTDPNQYSVVKNGFINVTPNKNTTCQTNISLTSIRFEAEDRDTYNWEAGGIWRQTQGQEGSAMHTPPDLAFDQGTLTLTVINVSGRVDDHSNLVYENTTISKNRTDEIRETIFTGDCTRPDNVTITVRSDFYEGWSHYLDSEINATSIKTYSSNKSVVVFLDQDKLPEVVNDEKNNVVDLNDSSFNDVEITNTSIKVNKSANNTYTTIVTPLTTGSTQVGEIRSVDADVVDRPPMDVVFVYDKSGSMNNPSDKIVNAKDAGQAFVAEMNSSFDRAGVVTFNSDGFYEVTDNGEYLTDDFSMNGVNGSIEDISTGGGTHIGEGIRKGNSNLGLLSNSSRHKVLIVLGDGKNDCCSKSESELNQETYDLAEQADKNDITIHTVGFGDPDNETMETVANMTGGTYKYVDDVDDLTSVFKDLFAEISQSKQIVRDPLTLQLSGEGTTYYPQIDGETDHIANDTNGSLNLNDPLAPSEFSFSIDISDGENVSMTAYDYECDEWEATGIIHKNQSTGNEYAEVRCTEINDSSITALDPDNSTVYLDGDNVSDLLNQPKDWWQEDLQNETLAPYLEADNETLDLKSNEAMVVFRFPDGDNSVDRMIVHYRIGDSKEDAVPRHVFNIQVRQLFIEEND